ncbi:hypothetical protein acdb102_03560 [Acidothermaceae bacterium B102]|nr:hypothetical protein acdb102_03560 [Acidothermaceae bacterium B102]
MGAAVAGSVDPLEDRHAEGQRLAGAGAGLADDVLAGEGQGNGQSLDGERLDDADGLEGIAGLLPYAEIAERAQGKRLSKSGRVGAKSGSARAALLAGRRPDQRSAQAREQRPGDRTAAVVLNPEVSVTGLVYLSRPLGS